MTRKPAEWGRVMEDRGLKISRKKAGCIGCKTHRYIKVRKVFTYLGTKMMYTIHVCRSHTHSVKRVEELEEILWTLEPCLTHNEREYQQEAYRTRARPAQGYGAEHCHRTMHTDRYTNGGRSIANAMM